MTKIWGYAQEFTVVIASLCRFGLPPTGHRPMLAASRLPLGPTVESEGLPGLSPRALHLGCKAGQA